MTYASRLNQNEMEHIVNRILVFLETCGDADIEAGVGTLLGLGSKQDIAKFRQGFADAIRGKPEK